MIVSSEKITVEWPQKLDPATCFYFHFSTFSLSPNTLFSIVKFTNHCGEPVQKCVSIADLPNLSFGGACINGTKYSSNYYEIICLIQEKKISPFDLLAMGYIVIFFCAVFIHVFNNSHKSYKGIDRETVASMVFLFSLKYHLFGNFMLKKEISKAHVIELNCCKK